MTEQFEERCPARPHVKTPDATPFRVRGAVIRTVLLLNGRKVRALLKDGTRIVEVGCVTPCVLWHVLT